MKPVTREEILTIQGASAAAAAAKRQREKEEWIASKIKHLYENVLKYIHTPSSGTCYKDSTYSWPVPYRTDRDARSQILEGMRVLFPDCAVYYEEQMTDWFVLQIDWS